MVIQYFCTWLGARHDKCTLHPRHRFPPAPLWWPQVCPLSLQAGFWSSLGSHFDMYPVESIRVHKSTVKCWKSYFKFIFNDCLNSVWNSGRKNRVFKQPSANPWSNLTIRGHLSVVFVNEIEESWKVLMLQHAMCNSFYPPCLLIICFGKYLPHGWAFWKEGGRLVVCCVDRKLLFAWEYEHLQNRYNACRKLASWGGSVVAGAGLEGGHQHTWWPLQPVAYWPLGCTALVTG